MNILFATSECAPFIKTGGLADVSGALPKALAKLGHDVRVILPLYEGIDQQWRSQMTFLQCFHITVAWRTPYCGIFELKRDSVTYWFVDNEYYFKRSAIYGHYDDGERFAYFSRAVVEAVGYLDWQPDVLHCNDWQTALVPIYLLEDTATTGRPPWCPSTCWRSATASPSWPRPRACSPSTTSNIRAATAARR